MNSHISDLTPGIGERVVTAGGTRAGKSALMEWSMRDVQHSRPTAMQILVDTKPRFRAETERGRFRGIRGSRKSAAYRYESWTAGPVVPNSVVVDIWDENPFKNIWHENRPGEIAIMQGADLEDWKRMLLLLKGYVNAHIKGRERRIVVDESLDFTAGTHSASIPRTTFSTAPPARAANVVLASKWERTVCTDCRLSFFTCAHDSTCFICETIKTCDTSMTAECRTPNLPREITFSVSTEFNPEVLFRNRTPVVWYYLTGISGNYRNREER
jgi:hypothetical protein